MATETTGQLSNVRFFSDHLMLDMGNALIEREIVTRNQINELNAHRALTGESLDSLLVKEALADETDVLSVLSELSRIPFVHMADETIEQAAVDAVQSKAALRHRVMPIRITRTSITLVTSRVPDLTTVDGLRMLLDMTIDWRLCTSVDISKSLTHFYGLGAESIEDLVDELDEEDDSATGIDLTGQENEVGIVRFINMIIAEAINMDATDIHIEPFENRLRLRYRIDGILQEIPLPKGVEKLRKAVPSAVKIMADMDIAEKRQPHDGRIKVRNKDSEFDLRVSVLPSGFGETVNMRILTRSTSFINLKNLGLTEDQMPNIEQLCSLPHGVILLTGPTGSGKTTTLYALLNRISNVEIKIITVEDPIEYQMEGITQIQTHAKINLTFASILRSILRHDPDVILIGEIRDGETADIAVRSSLTGHLVFSTLHTNDAPSAIARLTDMGVESYLISSCLEGVIAQRLVRRVCVSCKEEEQPPDSIIQEVTKAFPEEMAAATFFKGHGCPDCNFTGYKGRNAIISIMMLTDRIRSLIVQQRPSNDIRDMAVEEGMVTLRTDGWHKVLAGITSVDEVLRVARKSESS